MFNLVVEVTLMILMVIDESKNASKLSGKMKPVCLLWALTACTCENMKL